MSMRRAPVSLYRTPTSDGADFGIVGSVVVSCALIDDDATDGLGWVDGGAEVLGAVGYIIVDRRGVEGDDNVFICGFDVMLDE